MRASIRDERLSRFVSCFLFWPEASSGRSASRARGADDGHHSVALPLAHGEAGGIDLLCGRFHGRAISTLIHSGTSLAGETLSRWIGRRESLAEVAQGEIGLVGQDDVGPASAVRDLLPQFRRLAQHPIEQEKAGRVAPDACPGLLDLPCGARRCRGDLGNRSHQLPAPGILRAECPTPPRPCLRDAPG